jgi:hypothetical protein
VGRFKKSLWTFIGCALLGALLAIPLLSYLDMPTVEYSTATRKPVGCLVEPVANGVNWLPASDLRCKEIIAGTHEHEWVP